MVGVGVVCSVQHITYCLKIHVCPPLTVKSSSPWVIPFQIQHNAVLAVPTAAYSVSPTVIASSWVASAPSAPSSVVAVPPSTAAASLSSVPAGPSSSVASCTAGPVGLAS